MEIFERRIQFERYKKKKDNEPKADEPKTVRINCPQRIATAYLARTAAWRLSVL
jgi:hypothetical protein